MTTARLEMILRKRGLDIDTVIFKTALYLPESATFLGFYGGFELWLGFRSNIIYKIA